MPEQKPKLKMGSIVLGIIVWIVFLLIIFGIIRYIYVFVNPPLPESSIAVSYSFKQISETDTSYAFNITGKVQSNGSYLKSGKAKISLIDSKTNIEQSVFRELGEGEFIVFNEPGFEKMFYKSGKFSNKDMLIIVEVWSDLLTEPIIKEIYLSEDIIKTTRTTIILFFIIPPIIFLFVFLYIFTGPRTPRKNRWAFIFSYIVIFLTLITPLLIPPVLTYAFPDVLEKIKYSPVGLVISNTEFKSNYSYFQWAINIGGYAHPIEGNEKLVVVEGGIVIPLYVILLAILGGSINMTRKVPKYQEDQWTDDITLNDLFPFFKSGKTELSETGGEKSIKPPNESGEEDKSKKWRQNLLNEYMILISAPFLGIATYYLLYWVGSTETPILVLVSFSIGLISEQIINKITETAKSIFRSKKGSDSRDTNQNDK